MMLGIEVFSRSLALFACVRRKLLECLKCISIHIACARLGFGGNLGYMRQKYVHIMNQNAACLSRGLTS